MGVLVWPAGLGSEVLGARFWVLGVFTLTPTPYRVRGRLCAGMTV